MLSKDVFVIQSPAKGIHHSPVLTQAHPTP